MCIVVRDTISGEFSFLQKGADVVMVKIAQRNDWLKEETTNLLSEAMYEDFKCGTTL
jgi:phospholipid-translocating ATPase